MRIVIDMQALQADRCCHLSGDGFLSLLHSFVDNTVRETVILAFSSLLPESIRPLRDSFEGKIPPQRMRVWWAPEPEIDGASDDWRRHAAERIRESFLISLEPDILLMPGLLTAPTAHLGRAAVVKPVKGICSILCFEEPAPIADSALEESGGPQTSADHCLVFTVSQSGTLADQLEHLGLQVTSVAVDPEKKALPMTSVESMMALFRRKMRDFVQLPPRQAYRDQKPKLAYVSPMPPERTGIADYGAELLPELARYYDLEVITDQETISCAWIRENCTVNTVDGFRQNPRGYDRVLYHFGNSPYHRHMFDLLVEVPGVVVLHDFYLSDVQLFRESKGYAKAAFTRALLESHGYLPVARRANPDQTPTLVQEYPCNFSVIKHARAIIVHSHYARQLARRWYASSLSPPWTVVPFPRSPAENIDRQKARRALGFDKRDFVVCSFGLLGPNKLNHLLLQAWRQSLLSDQDHCFLVFVGENDGGEYGAQISEAIANSGIGGRIRITGWADRITFRNYLAAADLAVQLRTRSRGETSGTVFDCMNHALPLIVNANGAMAELPADAVWLLPDRLSTEELVEALEIQHQNADQRKALAQRALAFITTHHHPARCVAQYVDTIEQCHAARRANPIDLIQRLTDSVGHAPTDTDAREFALAVSQSLPAPLPARQLFIDVTATLREDLKTGIQRVVKSMARALLQAPPEGFQVEPVYLDDSGGVWHYRYARQWTLTTLFDAEQPDLRDEPVDLSTDDELLILDYNGPMTLAAVQAGLYERFGRHGVGMRAVVYDLLPIRMPWVFPPCRFGYADWLDAMAATVDGFVCISNAVADELSLWLRNHLPQGADLPTVRWFHLGADVENAVPSHGLPADADQLLARICRKPTFLMVGTIEPRKGYLQAIEAFTRIWRQGLDVNLVIVGREGWLGLPDTQRRTIPNIVRRIRSHAERDNRLFWLEGISDEYLEKIYAAVTCLIAASEGEGFGLPIIEAAQHKLPIIARDLPVFREVAGTSAWFFPNDTDPATLAEAVTTWLVRFEANQHPRSEGISWLTWQQSAEHLRQAVLGDRQESAILESNDP